MARKLNKSAGKAVIYTKDGVKIVEAREVADTDNYIKLGYVNEMPPAKIDGLIKFTRTKFFRLILDLQRLAQFEPIHNANWVDTDAADLTLDVPEIDAQLYRKYDFAPAMIKFVEERYSYDDAVHDGQD